MFATFSADQCLPVSPSFVNTIKYSGDVPRLRSNALAAQYLDEKFQVLSVPKSWLTKVRRGWVGDIIDVILGVLEIPLLERNTDREHLISDSPVAFLPRMRLAISLLMDIISARSWSREASENEGRRDRCG